MGLDNILHRMRDSLHRYSKITAQVIQAVISIVDDRQIRITYEGGTWEHSPGVNIHERGNIVKAALVTGKPQMMFESRTHSGCDTCKNRETCQDTLEMWVPIIIHQTVVGVIGVNCETERQRRRVAKSWKTYLRFLQQMAELISFEARQLLEAEKNGAVTNLLEAVVERMDSGIMVLDKAGNIMRLNGIGRRILQGSFSALMEQPVSLSASGERIGPSMVYQVSEGIEHCTVAGALYVIDIEPYSQILIFNDIELSRARASRRSAFYQIAGVSQEIERVRNWVRMAAASPSCVLIEAESGVEKDLFARAIHDESDRRDAPFITIDCSLLSGLDAEKYLFGTAAPPSEAGQRGKPGQFEAAANGTIFLDNIEMMPLPLQQKTAKLIERREILRMGSKKPRRFRARVISSASPGLREACAEGRFDRSLYYLANIIPIAIPPLRDRRVDIRPLASGLLGRYARELGKTIISVDEGFWNWVESYPWPGNLRELQGAMEYVINMLSDSGIVQAELLPQHLLPQLEMLSLRTLNLEEVEKETIRRAMDMHRQGHASMEAVAKELGIGTATLYRKIKKYGLSPAFSSQK